MMSDENSDNCTYIIEDRSDSEDSTESDEDHSKKAALPVPKSAKVASGKNAKIKVQKAGEKSKANGKISTASHPKYLNMALEAIGDLKERSGSSRQAIMKYINTKYGIEEAKARQYLRQALINGVESGALLQVKGTGASGSFKVAKKKPENSDNSASGSVTKKISTGGQVAKKPPTEKSARKTAGLEHSSKNATGGKPASKKVSGSSASESKPRKSAPKQSATSKSASVKQRGSKASGKK